MGLVEDIYRVQKEDVLEIFHESMKQMHPGQMIRSAISLENNILRIRDSGIELKDEQGIWIIGTGSAAATMAEGLESKLGDRIKGGLIIVPEDTKPKSRIIRRFAGSHPLPGNNSLLSTYRLLENILGYRIKDRLNHAPESTKAGSRIIKRLTGNHPLPGNESLVSTNALLKFIEQIPSGDILMYCLSGATSALLCMPEVGIELKDIRKVNKILLNSGVNIHEMNTVRKQISKIKGGGLLKFIKDEVHLIDLIISNVPDNHLEDIGSAPTLEKKTGFWDVMHILDRYHLFNKMPGRVRDYLNFGYRFEGVMPENPDNNPKHRHETYLLNSAEYLARKVGEIAEKKGYNSYICDQAYNDDVRTVADHITSDAISVLNRHAPVEPPAALIYFGESTVNVTGNGLGGRSQELALSALLSIEGQHNITILSVGTDGRDGPTDATGAICTSVTASAARKIGFDPESYLHNNDSYHFFEKMGGLLITGPTGNNLMDLQIVLVTS
jgi:glycerate 2-kinase